MKIIVNEEQFHIILKNIKKGYDMLIEENNSKFIYPNDGELFYLTIDKSYAEAYANGIKSAAHHVRNPIKSGVIVLICIDDIKKHYGGDIWKSAYKYELIEDLENYKNEYVQDEYYSTHILDKSTKDFLELCEIYDEPELYEIEDILNNIKDDNLSFVSPIKWSYFQEKDMGYSEICVKKINKKNIIKIEFYKDGKVIKNIESNYNKNCINILYHGSPIEKWNYLL